ncbi:hypothetical protein EW026_g7521 [Hermanssonia centrifuga]|uniref:Uncharacterized protein n=1 Tax=Hermanssonia centrifuga TaxID=98765 RepID=A0A4S4K7J9_9APHY|nr:hypothetical protein EW026_g7521 [Hermanssonia centrifuga]
MTTDEQMAAKKKKERTHESFIVVRPPPSKSNHPLNLQVQLVPPTGRAPTLARRSLDSDRTDTELSRTPSNRSEVSAYSSVTSFSTVSSTSTSSARRMIIPLYNLQAHNVMTNVIVDAGTDAKIAKFVKRGLEVIGLAILEPIELSGYARYEDATNGRHLLSPDMPHTPTSSHLSLNSDNPHDSPPVPTSPAPPTPTPERTGARRLFGKVFRRKDNSPASSGSPTIPSMSLPNEGYPSKRSSLLLNQPPNLPLHGADPPSTPSYPTVLGIQPIIRSPSPAPGTSTSHRRPTSYVWIVRRWLKGPPEGVSTSVESLVEVRLDWTRGAAQSKRGRHSTSTRQREDRRSSTGHHSRTPSTSSHSHGPSPQITDKALERSPSPRHSIRTSTTSEDGGSPQLGEREDDEGDESDPEDSETPWTCHLVVRRLHPHPSHGGGGGGAELSSQQPGDVRVKVAAVVPAPHHPKVVALLKIPFPLPDLVLTSRWPSSSATHSHGGRGKPFIDVEARRRIVTPAGVARPATELASPPGTPTQAGIAGNVGKFAANAGNFLSSGGKALRSNIGGGGSSGAGAGGAGAGGTRGEGTLVSGVLLSAEEIKDVVNCTALWVVVREAFGGVGRVSRKGDGWRIRG